MGIEVVKEAVAANLGRCSAYAEIFSKLIDGAIKPVNVGPMNRRSPCYRINRVTLACFY
jgi:hypothetical protein